MHILITNDDGIFAPGITILAQALAKIAKISVIAPDQNRSGVSRAITLENPLRIMKTPTGWWQLNGTPADCVKIALNGFLNDEPDMVVSGINAGANLGDDVLYSGTVGGAMEGRFLKYPPIAISSTAQAHDQMFYETAAAVACDLVQQLEKKEVVDPGLILNVNVPSIPFNALQGYKITRQGGRHISEPIIVSEDGRGRRIYWLGDSGKIKDGSEGTDFHAIHANQVSITPLHIDLTAHHQAGKVKEWFDI